MPDKTTEIFLMDNGSLEPASVLSLRAMTDALALRLGRRVQPLSLLHSSAILSQEINSLPAEIFESAIEKRVLSGSNDFLIVPAFFGPSSALTDYLPRRVTALKKKYPQLRVRLAGPLMKQGAREDSRIAEILETRVRHAASSYQKKSGSSSNKPAVILVDHGSPVRAVAEVRDHIADQLRVRLDDSVQQLVAGSMERRPGPEYAFSDPLLETVLDQSDFQSGLVIVALLFLSPGRHAGPNGDIAKICAAAATHHPQLQTVMTAPIGPDPLLIEILADRAIDGLCGSPL